MSIQSLRTDDCIEEVMGLYSPMVYRIALAHVKNRNDADDVFQDVFLKYFEKNLTFESEEHRKAWLIRVTLLVCKKFWASPWRKHMPAEEASVTFELPEENRVYSALLELPLRYRTVLYLFYFEDLPVSEISRSLGRKPAAVRMQLTRGRALMKEKLKGDDWDETPAH